MSRGVCGVAPRVSNGARRRRRIQPREQHQLIAVSLYGTELVIVTAKASKLARDIPNNSTFDSHIHILKLSPADNLCPAVSKLAADLHTLERQCTYLGSSQGLLQCFKPQGSPLHNRPPRPHPYCRGRTCAPAPVDAPSNAAGASDGGAGAASAAGALGVSPPYKGWVLIGANPGGALEPPGTPGAPGRAPAGPLR